MKPLTPYRRTFTFHRLRRRARAWLFYFTGIFASMAAGAAIVNETVPWLVAGV